MTDRVASDHPSVETYRATLGRYGGTRRPELRLPDAIDVPDGDVIRLVIDGEECHAQIETRSDGTAVIRGAYANARLARDRGGDDRLAAWARDSGLDTGRSVLVDVVVSGVRYGLRLPGTDAVYGAGESPSESLRDIAEGLGDGR